MIASRYISVKPHGLSPLVEFETGRVTKSVFARPYLDVTPTSSLFLRSIVILHYMS
jgi:hypothetical protein